MKNINTLLLASASVLAIGLATQGAFAEGNMAKKSNNPESQEHQTQTMSENDAKEMWNETKESVKNAYNETKKTVKNALNGDESSMTFSITNAASFYLGRDVTNPTGDTIASVHDILLDNSGNAQYAVLRNGGLMGVGGELVVIDFSSLSSGDIAANDDLDMNAEAEIKLSLTEIDLDQASEYTESQYGQYTSVDKLMDGQVLDENNNIVSYIAEVVIDNNQAHSLILSSEEDVDVESSGFVALSYDLVEGNLIENGSETNIRISQSNAASLKQEMMKQKPRS